MRSPQDTWNDPRTGSEVGWRRITEGLQALGHEAFALEKHVNIGGLDATVSINEPDVLRGASGLRVCMFWLNEFSFCKEGFDDHVDLYCSPSEAHRQKAIGDWGAPNPDKWVVNKLGCDVSHQGGPSSVSGRVVYCSSPDRALHRLLESWPSIKRAVPHATLRIFYRLQPWIEDLKAQPYFPPIEKLRARALYVEEALKRLSGPEWGITVFDSVDRDRLGRELAEAEVFAYPCETTSWSEGFSCSTLEACAAEACPIITDCDAFGDVYRTLDPVPVGDWQSWRDRVVLALTDADFRRSMNARAKTLATELTWDRHVKQLETEILCRL
jgi:glycosyltransferase involved in cell wall biosynthesis